MEGETQRQGWVKDSEIRGTGRAKNSNKRDLLGKTRDAYLI